MDLKNYSTGVQHIGIPTNDIDKTVDFYHKPVSYTHLDVYKRQMLYYMYERKSNTL